MKILLLTFITTIAFVSQAGALDIKAITAKPAAHNPQYDNKEVWPTLAGDEYFTKQKWPKARLLIWAHPGENPSRDNPRDPMDPANWIDAATGKPADALPDMDTDVILPDSDKKYSVIVRGNKVNLACRHLTVGRGANYQPAGGREMSISGNIWVRPNATLHIYRTLHMVGNSHTFIRRDWPGDGVLKKMHETGAATPAAPDVHPHRDNPWRHGGKHGGLCHFSTHDKPEGSTEIVGFVRFNDEFNIRYGTFIVGRDSRFLGGFAATKDIRKGAKFALMDGAMTGHVINCFGPHTVVHEGGALTGGLPDRPLKRDARVGLGYSNWMRVPFTGYRNPHFGWNGLSGVLSGEVVGYIAPESDAQLIVGWQRNGILGGPLKDGFDEKYADLIPKITVWVNEGTQIENVRFEDLHRGGLILPDREAFKKWKNVTFGDGCLSKDPDELLREFKGTVHRGRPRLKELPVIEKYITM